jgi:hypothetical protein
MNTLLAVDDGLVNAEYNWSDIWFLVATVLAVIAAASYWPTTATTGVDSRPVWPLARWAGVALALAVAATAFAFFLL